MRHLHTIKGSARMAGAMRLGELVHEMETRIEAAMQLVSVPSVVIEDLQSQFDHALSLFDDLHAPSQPTRAVEPDVTGTSMAGGRGGADEGEGCAAQQTAPDGRRGV